MVKMLKMFNSILVEIGWNSCWHTRYPQLFLLDTQHSLICSIKHDFSFKFFFCSTFWKTYTRSQKQTSLMGASSITPHIEHWRAQCKDEKTREHEQHEHARGTLRDLSRNTQDARFSYTIDIRRCRYNQPNSKYVLLVPRNNRIFFRQILLLNLKLNNYSKRTNNSYELEKYGS